MDYIPYDESYNDERTVYPYYTVQDINTPEIRRKFPSKSQQQIINLLSIFNLTSQKPYLNHQVLCSLILLEIL